MDGAGRLSAGAAVPYALALQAERLEATPLPLSLPAILLLQTAQMGLLMCIGAVVGLTLGRAVGLDSPLARAWLDATGVEMLCRIHRLLALLEAVDPSRPVNWTELAHRFGFYDQAYFNHEFRQLAGLYPSEYLDQRRLDLPELGKGKSVAFVPRR